MVQHQQDSWEVLFDRLGTRKVPLRAIRFVGLFKQNVVVDANVEAVADGYLDGGLNRSTAFSVTRRWSSLMRALRPVPLCISGR
jgi:hypothetical protein